MSDSNQHLPPTDTVNPLLHQLCIQNKTSTVEIDFRIPGKAYAGLPPFKASFDDKTCKITDSLTRETFDTPHQWARNVYERETKNKKISSKHCLSVGGKRIAEIELEAAMSCRHTKRQVKAIIPFDYLIQCD
jgi:hypothetical protein